MKSLHSTALVPELEKSDMKTLLRKDENAVLKNLTHCVSMANSLRVASLYNVRACCTVLQGSHFPDLIDRALMEVL